VANDGDALQLTPEGEPRDVYYIVLDRYAGLATLAREYGFDNSPFYEELEERGFFMGRESHANYIKTPLSLVSTLTMNYLDADALAADADSGRDREPIHSRLRAELTVPHALKQAGYSYIHIANWWEPTITNVDADRTYHYEGQSEFAAALWQTTLLSGLGEEGIATPSDPWDWRTLRQHSVYGLSRLDASAELGGPKYVFAHFLLPHDPYVFDIDGSFMDREQVEAQGQTESYLRQLQYLNRRILEIVDHILEASDTPPIFVIQADEGPFPDRYRVDEWGFTWTEASDAELGEKFNILNAILLPGADHEAVGLHDAITPVNTFRIVFNTYFGTDLPLLEDRTYAHTDLYHFYEFFEITDRLRTLGRPEG
jgi:hypothetical protein